MLNPKCLCKLAKTKVDLLICTNLCRVLKNKTQHKHNRARAAVQRTIFLLKFALFSKPFLKKVRASDDCKLSLDPGCGGAAFPLPGRDLFLPPYIPTTATAAPSELAHLLLHFYSFISAATFCCLLQAITSFSHPYHRSGTFFGARAVFIMRMAGVRAHLPKSNSGAAVGHFLGAKSPPRLHRRLRRPITAAACVQEGGRPLPSWTQTCVAYRQTAARGAISSSMLVNAK